MSRKHIRWLHQQLPQLVAQGVLSAEAAARLHAHYEGQKAGSARTLAVTAFAILGSTLVAAGIVLLFAYNWAQFGRPLRAVLALALVLLGQAAVGFTLVRNKSSAAYREGAGLFAQLTFGAGFALIAQTYHLSDDFGSFLLTWMLATLPLAYLLGATGPALIYLAGVTWWAGSMNAWNQPGSPALWWVWVALVMPYAIRVMRREPYHPRAILLMWGLAIAGSIGAMICVDSGWDTLWPVIFSGLFVSMYLAGSFWQGDGTTLWQQPLSVIGGSGATVLAFLLTFGGFWDDMGWRAGHNAWGTDTFATLHDLTLAVVATVTSVLLVVTCRRRHQLYRLGLGLVPVLAALGYALNTLSHSETMETACFIAANLYVLAFGILALCAGIRQQHLGGVNYGMLVIAALLVARFFNSDIGFIAKGIAFIVMGCGFLTVNVVMARRKGGRV